MKKLILMLALFSAVIGANAQIATENSNALDNIGVGVTAGVSTPLDFNSVFPVNPNVGLKITKDFTPSIGIQVEGLAILNDNHFSDIKTTVKATNVGLNGTVNLSNAIWGYNGTPRTFEVSTVGGLGWLHSWNTSVNNMTAKTGLDLTFNFGRTKAHSLVLTLAVYWNLNKFNDIKFDKRGSQLALNLTYVYHFKTSNGTRHFKTYDVGAMVNEISRLNGALEECEKREPKVIEKVKIIEKVIKVETPQEAPKTAAVAVVTKEVKSWTVSFASGKSTLSNEAKNVLKKVAKGTIVDVVATSSPDGNKELNQRLSEARAKSVADFLIKNGVKVKSAVGKGADANSTKSVTVTVAQ